MLCKQIQFFLGIIFSIKRFFEKTKIKKKSQNQDEAIASSCLMQAMVLITQVIRIYCL